MNTEERTQILSRIAALEYLLETGYATWVLQMSETEIEEFQKDFEARLSTTWVSIPGRPLCGPIGI